MQRTTGPPDAPTANDGPLNFDTTASSGRWKPDQISSITGIHDAHITIAGATWKPSCTDASRHSYHTVRN
jgi:hypothetical protein